MKISTVLDHIDSGHMALPEFQRGYVWNRDQVRSLMQSLYRRHPVGSLLVWVTQSEGAQYRGDGKIAPGVVKLLLDGQQRMSTLYGIIRGKPPKFFDGNTKVFTGLHFHLENEEFVFYMPKRMKDDPLWVDVTKVMKEGFEYLIPVFSAMPGIGKYIERLSRIIGVKDTELHVDEVTGEEKKIDVVVDIFNRVNSGGTKLSKGDLALAKICAESPEARERMKKALKRWKGAGLQFNLDWLLRNVNTVATGEAKFNAMHTMDSAKFEDGLKRAEKAIDYLLNIISGRLGLDHDRVFFGRYAMPVMTHYLDRKGGKLEDHQERDKLLFWYLHSAMWGRFSGSTESKIDRDLELIENLEDGLDMLIDELRLWRGGLRIDPAHFRGWSRGARFYPVLYLLTRIGESKDWGTGLPLKDNLLGKMSKLEVHHIFPKARLYKHPNGYKRPQVNAVANFCFLTKDTNLEIRADPPEVYFPRVEEKYPGALASQWIPMDSSLWNEDKYLDFLEERRKLLAEAANSFLQDLLHDSARPDEKVAKVSEDFADEIVAPSLVAASPKHAGIPGSIETEEEEEELRECNEWVVEMGLPEGVFLHEQVDEESGEALAIFDLAWPNGLQEGFSQPVAVLLNEGPETLAVANHCGYRYFTNVDSFKRYVEKEVLAVDEDAV